MPSLDDTFFAKKRAKNRQGNLHDGERELF